MINPLDIQTLFVNVFAGNMLLFTGILIVLFSGLAARFKMPNIIFGIMLVLFAVIMSAYAPFLFVVSILITGLIVFYTLAKLVKN